MKFFSFSVILSVGLLLFSCGKESFFSTETEQISNETEAAFVTAPSSVTNTAEIAPPETFVYVPLSSETFMHETELIEIPQSETNAVKPPSTETATPETINTMSADTLPEELPPELNTSITSTNALEILLEIYRLVSDTDTVSLYYTDVNGEYFFGIGENTTYHSASTVKAVYCQYLMESKVDLNQKILFTHVTRKSSSGKLTADSLGKEFTVEELIRYTLRTSDNQAYSLLFHTFGTEDYNRYVSHIGAETLTLSPENEWAYCSPKDLSTAMMQIYHASQRDPIVTEHLKNTEYNAQISQGTEYTTAHKYGYNGKNTGFHDTAIVYAHSSPYVLTVMTLLDPTEPKTISLFRDLASLCDRLNVILFGQ